MSAIVRTDSTTNEAEARKQRLTARHERLMATDPQYRAAVPPESVIAAKKDPAVRVPELMAATMDACADRPALGRRATRIVTDPASGRRSLELLDEYETLTYRELWSDVRALASVWQHDESVRTKPGELVCILGFAGVGFVTVDLAATHAGAVSVPLQTNAPLPQLVTIIREAEPRCFAASIENLDTAVEMVLTGYAPVSLLVLEYHPEDDEQRAQFERAAARLASAGCATRLESLATACERGRRLPPATLVVPAPDEDPLMTIYYTSGSTGSPKGAMLGERMSGVAWRVPDTKPLITLNYMPMNHSFGRILVLRTLAAGGICYFVGRSDLSTLFDDIARVRPTFVNLVTRICEMIFNRYQAELSARRPGADEEEAIAAVRDRQMGGRILAAAFGAAPITAELRAFIERCLDVSMPNGYGATEIMGVTMENKVMRPPIIDWKLVDVPELGYFRTDKPYPRGELLVKTEMIMQGYYKNPAATAAVFDEDGYYKTGDVMAQIGPDELIYVDRRNNVQKLAQGEFVAIAQLESTYSARHPLIDQMYLYGTSERAFLLAVVVPNVAELAARGLTLDQTDAVRAKLREAIQEVATHEDLQAYEVPRDLIVEAESFSAENGLLTGIGKPRRPALKEHYGPRLEAMYEDLAAKQSQELEQLRSRGATAPVLETVVGAVRATLGVESINPDAPLSFGDLGGDSLSALSLSMLLEEIYGLEVPVGVITHPAGNLRKLAEFIEQVRDADTARPTVSTVHGRDATEVRASDLTLEKFIDPDILEHAAGMPAVAGSPPRTVLLTGANGFLGRFLCLEWLERLAGTDGRLICVVRGADAHEARARIRAAIDSGDDALLEHFSALAERHLEVHAGDLSEPRLGLDVATWDDLCASVDVIVNPAALVNHVLPYAQLFGPNVVATAELIRLALTWKLKRFVHVSTVAVAMSGDRRPLDEDADVRVAAPQRSLSDRGYASGYATSKWASEVLLREAHDRFGLPVSIFRSDMILAHRRYRGQLNVPDMFTRLLYSIVTTGLAPRSFYEKGTQAPHYDGLPVDFTAASIVTLGERVTRGLATFHVLNPHDDGISLDDFVDWIEAAGSRVQRVEHYEDWLNRFETALKGLPEKQRQQSFLPLLHQLRRPMRPEAGSAVSARRFRTAVQRSGIGADPDIPHVSRELIAKYVDDIRLVGLLDGGTPRA